MDEFISVLFLAINIGSFMVSVFTSTVVFLIGFLLGLGLLYIGKKVAKK